MNDRFREFMLSLALEGHEREKVIEIQKTNFRTEIRNDEMGNPLKFIKRIFYYEKCVHWRQQNNNRQAFRVLLLNFHFSIMQSTKEAKDVRNITQYTDTQSKRKRGTATKFRHKTKNQHITLWFISWNFRSIIK